VKKFFITIGFILLVAVLVFTGIKFYSQQQAAQYADTAVPYVKMVVPEISNWNPENIIKLMPEESLKSTQKEKITAIVKYLSRLGALVTMEEPDFKKVVTKVTDAGEGVTVVTYTVAAEYEQGGAEMTISLLDEGNSYQVYNFNINSEALAQ
jgi:hypothetical protein